MASSELRYAAAGKPPFAGKPRFAGKPPSAGKPPFAGMSAAVAMPSTWRVASATPGTELAMIIPVRGGPDLAGLAPVMPASASASAAVSAVSFRIGS